MAAKTTLPDLTIRETRDAFAAFRASVGPNCECPPRISDRGDSLVSAFFQPEGYCQGGEIGPFFPIYADTWRDLLAACEAKWAEHSDLHATNRIREMALAIITLTADQGECTDAALRAKFDAADIVRYGERACAQATEMASNGPFSIVKLSGANDAEAA